MSKYLTPAILTGLGLVYWACSKFYNTGLVDDSYIFLRYAKNFAGGHGLVFNIGERVEGFTSPLWVLLLGAAAWPGLDLVLTAPILSAAFGFVTIVVLFCLGRAYLSAGRGWPAFIPGWFLGTTPAFVFWTWSAMDTALFTFLFFCTFALFLRQVESRSHLLWPGVFFFLAAFARLGMLALLPVYLVFIYYFNRHTPALLVKKYLSFLAPAVLLVAYELWRYAYYGVWLPNTYYAKAANIPLSVLISSGLTYTANFIIVYGIYLVVGLAVPVVFYRKTYLKEWIFSAAVTVTWLAYVTYVGGDHFSVFRFYVAILPVVAFLLLFTVKLMVDRAASVGMVAATVLLLMMVIGRVNYAIFTSGGGQSARAEVENAAAWAKVGYWLKDNVPPDAKISTVVVGAIPYYSGLTNRAVATEGQVYLPGKVGHQKYHTDYILNQRPDYLISPASGLFSRPMGGGLDTTYNYSLYHLITDERATRLYEYQAIELDDGTFVEFLRLRN